jgi:chromosome segregation ATPase
LLITLLYLVSVSSLILSLFVIYQLYVKEDGVKQIRNLVSNANNSINILLNQFDTNISSITEKHTKSATKYLTNNQIEIENLLNTNQNELQDLNNKIISLNYKLDNINHYLTHFGNELKDKDAHIKKLESMLTQKNKQLQKAKGQK